MSDNLPFILFLVAFFLIFGFGIVLSIVRRRKLNDAFHTLALRTGMQVEEGSFLRRPRLSGSYQGRKAQIYTYTVRRGKNSTTYTAVAMDINNPNHYTLKLRREHALDGLGKRLGMQDLSTGDAEFDSKFVIQSQPKVFAPEMIRLYGNLRDALLRVPSVFIDLNGSTLRHHERGYQTNPDMLVNILDVLAGIAKAVDESEGGTKVAADPFDVPGEYGSDEALEPSLEDDPFYRKTPESQPAYPYDPGTPTGSGSGATLRVLILIIAAFAVLALAAIAVFMISS